MSEAEIPNNSSNLFESNPDQDASQPIEEGIVAIAPQTHEEWTTVDFPDAIPVDALPHAEPVERIQELERQNGELQEHVSSLEAALAHSETLRQSETERLETLAGAQYASAQQRSREHVALIAKLRKDLDFAGQRIREQDVQFAQRTQELVTAQEHLTQLFQELEIAHQSAQKQQILVETLTAQLESSQEQVAQLERECALTQQRYSEQLQGTRQAEILCRDLRSRLHRQQRYTLQFKAALEKCLDAPAHAPVHLPEQVELADEEGDLSDSSVAFVKSQPVQPWSASPGFPAFDAEFETTLDQEQVTSRDQASWTADLLAETSWMTDLPSDSFELQGQSASGSVQESHDSMEALHGLEDELNRAAPRAVRAQAPQSFVERSSEDCVIAPIPKAIALSYTIKHASSELADLQRGIQLFTPPEMPPVLRAGEVQRTAEVQRSAPISLEPTAPSEHSDRFVAEGIADQLDAVDQTGDNHDEVAISDDRATQDGLEIDQLEISKLGKVDEPAFTSLEANAIPVERSEEGKNEESKSASFVTFENHEGSSPFITLNSSRKQSVPLEQAGVAASSGSAPSPVVYPTRSQKKLPSLAAVDLPSFPKKVGR
ncbi:MAG: hypothetical protein KME43_03570 [Myxacorys chilensis ATA2-1-KO14]|jgi:hypothetical protein|nr:hypothetical protein [Myxacorys chilensis ATA2-1-KO14]